MRTTDLVNVALRGTASQSSLSEWSQPGEAANAVSGDIRHDFAFHTAIDPMPWWQIDLGEIYRIEAIVVHNRLAACQSRARTLTVEIAEDIGRWISVHIGYASFGARGYGYPFEVWLNSELRARYIRLSLREAQHFHLSQVEIFARPDFIALDHYCQRNGLHNFGRFSNDFGRPYSLEKASRESPQIIVGLKINISGRFGNLLLQYINAIEIARRTGLKYIQLGRHELMNISTPIEVEGLTFLPPDSTLPPDGLFISGVFFNNDVFAPLLSPFMQFEPADERLLSDISQTFIRPHLLTGVPLVDETLYEDEVTIHIRSGDIFETDKLVESMYRQPPLSFYTLVITRLRDEGLIRRARLVFEDRGNPCIEQLEAWLNARGMPYRTRSGALLDDLSALIDAPHVVFGYGTFGYAACRLSKRIKTLHYFAPELGGRYGFIPHIDRVFAVWDREGHYIRAGEWGKSGGGEWQNTAEQRAMMLAYPAEALQVDAVTGACSDSGSDSFAPGPVSPGQVCGGVSSCDDPAG